MDVHRYIPDHAVPMSLSTLVNSKNERIEFGTADVVRVQVMGIVEAVELKESDVEYVLADKKKENKIMVQKILTCSFTREQANQICVDDYVEVFGKVRVLSNGNKFLNAFSISKGSKAQYRAFQSIRWFSERFYKKNTPTLPSGSSTNAPGRYGLRGKVGSLNRFPIGLLEQSSSTENNMGVWPAEIEDLAAEASMAALIKSENSQKTDDETDGSVETSDSDVSEVEDDEEEDSFDAGPVKSEIIGKDEKTRVAPMINQITPPKEESDYDSFENY